MLGWHISTQCPWCEQPNTTLVIEGRNVTAIKHSTMAADLACKAIKAEVADEPTKRYFRPRLTLDYLAIAKCAADAAYVRQKMRDEAAAAAAEAFSQ